MDTPHTLRERFVGWLKAQTPKQSQADVAKLIPMSESHLSLVLDGKRPISMRKAARISDLTGIPLDVIAAAFVEDAVGAAQ